MGNGLMVDRKQRAELIDLIEAIRDGRGEENATGLEDAIPRFRERTKNRLPKLK
jgi:hypothetical protein